MNLWLLRPVDKLPKNDNPWEPWYAKAFGFVVRAETEQDARVLADKGAVDENRSGKHPWLNTRYSTCVKLNHKGQSKIVMRDFASA